MATPGPATLWESDAGRSCSVCVRLVGVAIVGADAVQWPAADVCLLAAAADGRCPRCHGFGLAGDVCPLVGTRLLEAWGYVVDPGGVLRC